MWVMVLQSDHSEEAEVFLRKLVNQNLNNLLPQDAKFLESYIITSVYWKCCNSVNVYENAPIVYQNRLFSKTGDRFMA
jgi:hypothetical protein